MYIKTEDAIKIGTSLIEQLGENIKDRFDILLELLIDTDWSFIIKSHAVIESTVTELIIAKINTIELKQIVSRLPLHGDEVSKISILKTYDLITKEQRTFLKKISQLRNDLVHRFENLSFTFTEFIDELDSNQIKSWNESLNWHLSDEYVKTKINFSKNTKLVFWLSIVLFIVDMLGKTSKYESIKKMETGAIKATRQILGFED